MGGYQKCLTGLSDCLDEGGESEDGIQDNVWLLAWQLRQWQAKNKGGGMGAQGDIMSSFLDMLGLKCQKIYLLHVLVFAKEQANCSCEITEIDKCLCRCNGIQKS